MDTDARVSKLETQMAEMQARFPVQKMGAIAYEEMPHTTGYLPVEEHYGKHRDWQGLHGMTAAMYRPTRKTPPTKVADWEIKVGHHDHWVARVLWYAVRTWFEDGVAKVVLDPVEIPRARQLIWEEKCLDVDDALNPRQVAKPAP